MKTKRLVLITVFLVLVVVSIGVVNAAFWQNESAQEVSDAIKAADVCPDHLEKDCEICNGVGVMASYNTICPFCNRSMTLCCSRSIARDDYYNNCYVMAHPSGCKTVQDWCWNAYVCRQCGYFQRGSRTDDMHVEAYLHDKDSTCCDDSYCSLPYYEDLIPHTSSHITSVSDGEMDTIIVRDPVAAADYCEVHGVFDCTIDHNDVVSE